jgi:hypothetical protein
LSSGLLVVTVTHRGTLALDGLLATLLTGPDPPGYCTESSQTLGNKAFKETALYSTFLSALDTEEYHLRTTSTIRRRKTPGTSRDTAMEQYISHFYKRLQNFKK